MPLRKSHRSVLAATALAVVAAVAPAGASAATASTATSGAASSTFGCAAEALSQALLKFGDSSLYALAPGGDFETGATGWTLKNAAVASGNETLGVLPGSKSLKLGTGIGVATATTPSFCVDPLHPMFRFTVKTNSPVASLTTTINFKAPLGVTLTVPAKLNTLGNGSWSVSTTQPLSTAIPKVFLGNSVSASITFTSAVATLGSSVSIDNLLIDPYRRG